MYRKLAKQAVKFHVKAVVGLEYDDRSQKFNLKLSNGNIYREASRSWVANEYPEDVVKTAMSMSTGYIPVDKTRKQVFVATSQDPIVKLKYIMFHIQSSIGNE